MSPKIHCFGTITAVLIKSDEAVHETREANQVLEETLKLKDMDINAMEEVIKHLKEECEKRIKEATEEVQQKNRMIRSLEEQLGVWDEDISQEPNENETAIQNEWITEEVRAHNTPVVKCTHCPLSVWRNLKENL